MRWLGLVTRKGGENINAQRILAVKPQRKRQLGRPWRQWKYNIKIDLRETVWDGPG